VHGSGFLAAFAAGLTIAALDVELCDCFIEYGGVDSRNAVVVHVCDLWYVVNLDGFSDSTTRWSSSPHSRYSFSSDLSHHGDRFERDSSRSLLIAWFGPVDSVLYC
jgi:hypothetical protein